MLSIKSTIIVLLSKTLQLSCLSYYVSWAIVELRKYRLLCSIKLHPYLDKDFDFRTLFSIGGKDFK